MTAELLDAGIVTVEALQRRLDPKAGSWEAYMLDPHKLLSVAGSCLEEEAKTSPFAPPVLSPTWTPRLAPTSPPSPACSPPLLSFTLTLHPSLLPFPSFLLLGLALPPLNDNLHVSQISPVLTAAHQTSALFAIWLP